MGTSDQARFKAAVGAAKTGDGSAWTAAVNLLSGLAMFDILPALAAINPADRARALQAALQGLSTGAFQRINFANNVITFQRLPGNDAGLPPDQVEDARRYLIDKLTPTASFAGKHAFPTTDAAARQAIDEIAAVTQAVRVEFSGMIYKQHGRFAFTAPNRGDDTSSSSDAPVPAGATKVATYHTHPDVNNNAENFSPQDMIICRGVKHGNAVVRPPLISYLGTPSGRIKKLTPPALLQGADATTFGLLGKLDILR